MAGLLKQLAKLSPLHPPCHLQVFMSSMKYISKYKLHVQYAAEVDFMRPLFDNVLSNSFLNYKREGLSPPPPPPSLLDYVRPS